MLITFTYSINEKNLLKPLRTGQNAPVIKSAVSLRGNLQAQPLTAYTDQVIVKEVFLNHKAALNLWKHLLIRKVIEP